MENKKELLWQIKLAEVSPAKFACQEEEYSYDPKMIISRTSLGAIVLNDILKNQEIRSFVNFCRKGAHWSFVGSAEQLSETINNLK